MSDAGGFFRGTSVEQDARFADKEKKLIASMTWPQNFNIKVDMKKVNLDVLKPWIAKTVTSMLDGFEDEVLIEYVIGLLEADEVDPKQIQINLTGFLDDNSSTFTAKLWNLLISAQETTGGIPREFLEKKKEELKEKKIRQDKLEAELQKKRDEVRDSIQRKTDTSPSPERKSRRDRSASPRNRSNSPRDRNKNRSPSPDSPKERTHSRRDRDRSNSPHSRRHRHRHHRRHHKRHKSRSKSKSRSRSRSRS